MRPASGPIPAQAVMLVEATAVDALAVAVGSTHAIRQRNAMLDPELITRLRFGPGAASSSCGPSGVDDEQLLGAVRHGQTKINIGTLLKARPSATVP
jgi:fructose-bisphosphate aldolase class II